jgi:3-carboxy-cis,cis-muconate cycloisomerase
MPHKRNPVGCAAILAAAIRVPGLVSVMLTAMVQEHERGLGDWHAEWDTLPEICCLAAGALAQLTQVLEGLEVDPARMAENLEATRGLILAEAVTMALGGKIGRLPAHHLVETACKRAAGEKRHLRDVLGEDAEVRKHLSAADLRRLLDPANYTGLAETLVERALAARTGIT